MAKDQIDIQHWGPNDVSDYDHSTYICRYDKSGKRHEMIFESDEEVLSFIRELKEVLQQSGCITD